MQHCALTFNMPTTLRRVSTQVVDLQPLTSLYAALHREAPPPTAAADLNDRLPPAQRMEVVGVEDGAPDLDDHHTRHHQQQPQQQTSNDSATTPRISGGGADVASSVDDSTTAGIVHAQDQERHVSLDEALRGHTSWAAEAAGLQGLVGRLAVGLRADFIELDLSPAAMIPVGGGAQLEGAWEVPAAFMAARGTKHHVGGDSGGNAGTWQGGRLPAVLRTWLDGKLVYDQQQQEHRPASRGAGRVLQQEEHGDGAAAGVWQVV